MATLDTFLDQAWSDHADQAAVVAARLPEALPLVADDNGVMRLAALAHHVFGEHLGHWQDGLTFLAQLSERAMFGADGASAIARCRASLRLCSGEADQRAALNTSDQCRVSSMAASNLAASNSQRSTELLQEAVTRASALPDADPGVRALAANSNGIAGTLQELASRTAEQRALMVQAAQVARAQWERAGTWLEVERAEYRLALCWLAAGDPALGLQHTLHCESIVQQNGSLPLEVFFASEALCLCARALGDTAVHSGAVATAQQAFEALPSDDQAWCRATLDSMTRTSGINPP